MAIYIGEKTCNKLDRKGTLKLKMFIFLTFQGFYYAPFTGKPLKFINNTFSNVSGLVGIAHQLFSITNMHKNCSSKLGNLQKKIEKY